MCIIHNAGFANTFDSYVDTRLADIFHLCKFRRRAQACGDAIAIRSRSCNCVRKGVVTSAKRAFSRNQRRYHEALTDLNREYFAPLPTWTNALSGGALYIYAVVVTCTRNCALSRSLGALAISRRRKRSRSKR